MVLRRSVTARPRPAARIDAAKFRREQHMAPFVQGAVGSRRGVSSGKSVRRRNRVQPPPPGVISEHWPRRFTSRSRGEDSGRDRGSKGGTGSRRDSRRRPGDRRRARPRGLLRLRDRPQQPERPGRSEIDRPETIEETGELIAAAGGAGLGARRRSRGPRRGRRAGREHRARPGPARRPRQRHLRRRPVHGVGQAAVGTRLGRRPTDAADGRAHPPDHLPRRASR